MGFWRFQEMEVPMDDYEEVDCSNLTVEELRAMSNCTVLRPDELSVTDLAVLAAIDEAADQQPTQH